MPVSKPLPEHSHYGIRYTVWYPSEEQARAEADRMAEQLRMDPRDFFVVGCDCDKNPRIWRRIRAALRGKYEVGGKLSVEEEAAMDAALEAHFKGK